METRFDEITKLLAANMPRREALSRIVGIAVGSLLGALGLGRTARAQQNPQALCILLCRNAQRVQNIWRLCILTCLNCPAVTTQLCGTFGTVCCLPGTICVSGRVGERYCVPCGMPDQPCCAGAVCTQGNLCVSGGTCVSCGNSGQPCCTGAVCSQGNLCVSGTCMSCGNSGQPCCAGGVCTQGNLCVSDSVSTCVSCGAPGQPCCAGSVCTQGFCNTDNNMCQNESENS